MMRMYTVAKLTKIVKLDLSDNHLMSIEGLRDLSNLTWLNLSNNKIKVSFNNLKNSKIFFTSKG